MHWVTHQNYPILSVDVQPNGFRFVTGGTDNKVCVWNLLPALSSRYENPPQQKDDKKVSLSPLVNGDAHHRQNLDEEMKEEASVGSEELWREREEEMLEEDEDGFEEDIKLMEGLI